MRRKERSSRKDPAAVVGTQKPPSRGYESRDPAVRDVESADAASRAEPAASELEVPKSEPVKWPTTVLVLGSGSNSATAVIQAIASSGHTTVAVEYSDLAASLRIASLGAVIPRPGDSSFGAAVEAVTRSSGATVAVAVAPEDVQALAGVRDELAEAGARIWVPSQEAFSASSDPRAVEELSSGSLTPDKTGLGTSAQAGTKRSHTFNVDVVAGDDYDLTAAVSSWTLVAHSGIVTAAETFTDPRLLDLVRAVCATIRMTGPAYIAGHEQDGGFRLGAITPGFSPLVPLARAAGVDIADLTLRGALEHELPRQLVKHRDGVRMLQYLDQVFEG